MEVIINNKITVSIVNHEHGEIINSLITKLLKFKEIDLIIITNNNKEKLDFISNEKLIYLQNQKPRGFGENHNNAFHLCKSKYFCVLNPDVLFDNNIFENIFIRVPENFGCLSVKVLNDKKAIEDSFRHFPTIYSILRKLIFKDKGNYSISSESLFYPNFVAGMFMLFHKDNFRLIGGFDLGYYMYYEDVDICARLLECKLPIIVNLDCYIIHNGMRSSHKKIKYFYWHLCSFLLFQFKFWTRYKKLTY
jgi:GT2 family glycosyltransferase